MTNQTTDAERDPLDTMCAEVRRLSDLYGEAAKRLRKARAQRAEANERARVAERRAEFAQAERRAADNVIRAMLDALGAGPNVDPVIKAREIAASRDHWKDKACELETRRGALASALHLPAELAWGELLDHARRRADVADANARADIAAARQNTEQAAQTLAMRHRQIAGALRRDQTTSWPDLIAGADRAYRTADMLASAERDRQAAEQRIRDLAKTLRETERQLGEARQRADGRAEAAEDWKRIATERREQAETAERYRATLAATFALDQDATWQQIHDAAGPTGDEEIPAAEPVINGCAREIAAALNRMHTAVGIALARALATDRSEYDLAAPSDQ